MLETINVAEDTGPWSILVYGTWGGGKTVFGAGATKVLYADAENSRKSLLNHPELAHMYNDIVICKTVENFRNLATDMRVNDTYETVCLDTITRIQRRDVVFIHKTKQYSKDKDLPSQAEFNASNRRMIQAVEHFIETANKNLLILCHDKEEKDDQGSTIVIRPGTSPSLTEMLAQTVDGVFYLDAVSDSKGAITRTLKTVPTRKMKAKNRFGSLPNEIPIETNQRNFLKIEKAIEIQKQRALALQQERAS